MPNPPTERDWQLITAMVRAALERIAAEQPGVGEQSVEAKKSSPGTKKSSSPAAGAA